MLRGLLCRKPEYGSCAGEHRPDHRVSTAIGNAAQTGAEPVPIKGVFLLAEAEPPRIADLIEVPHLILSPREPPSADRGVLPVSGGLPSILQTLSYSS